jgi:hypothetical protein
MIKSARFPASSVARARRRLATFAHAICEHESDDRHEHQQRLPILVPQRAGASRAASHFER